MPASNVAVTATWTPNQTTPTTFLVNVNGSNAANSGTGTYTAGQTVTIRAGSISGNNFNRWTTSTSGVSIVSITSNETTFVMPASNVTVTATWTPVTGGGTTTPPPGITPPPGVTTPPGGGTTTPPGGGTTTPPGDGTTTPPGDGGNDNIINAPVIIEPPEQPQQPQQPQQRFEPIDEPPPGNGGRGSNSRHVVREVFGDDYPVITIGDTFVPLVGPRHIATWALLNLILLIAGVVFAVYATTKFVVQRSKRKRDREEEIMSYMRVGRSFNEEESPGEKRMAKRKLVYVIAICILAIIGVILFIITQDMTRTMVFVDFWTLFHVVFVALQIVAIVLLAKRLKAVVTLRSSAGKSAAKENVLVGDPLEEPKSPVRSGYSFGGWYADKDFKEKWEFYRPINNDMTLYAKWNPTPGQALQQTASQAAPQANPV